MSKMINDSLDQVLAGFSKVTLQEIEEQKLLNRQDEKFLFNFDSLPQILENLIENYKILEINNHLNFSYHTIYYDTDDHQLYNHHHNKRANRCKIRRRDYLDTGVSFFEIKYKTNKEKTIKKRVQCGDEISFGKKALKLLKNNVCIPVDNLKPVLTVDYHRISLIHKSAPEKLTFDYQIYFRNTVIEKSLNDLVICEIKMNSYYNNSDFRKLMLEKRIKPVSFSKYCTGSILTSPDLKYNRFKNKMMILNKMNRVENGL